MWLASLLRQLADRIDAPRGRTGAVARSATPQADLAQSMVDDLTLRLALRAALRRYSPPEQIGEA